jgi:transcriptional regulator
MEQRAKVMKKAEVVRIAKKAKESLKKARKTLLHFC